MTSSHAAPPLYTTELSSKFNLDASMSQHGCLLYPTWLPTLAELRHCPLDPTGVGGLHSFPCLCGHLGVYSRLTSQATQGWPDRSISLAFLSSTQVWELTILDKINDLILLIHRLVSRWFHGFLRLLVGFHGFSSWFHGFSWFLVGFHGFSR